jgi:CHAT domain-containing protein
VNPLLRSGLALAGANAWLTGTQTPPEVGTGLLTAEEASSLDLTGTDLVVLSACDTGLGELYAGEGIFGLVRAFAVAGRGRSWLVSGRFLTPRPLPLCPLSTVN